MENYGLNSYPGNYDYYKSQQPKEEASVKREKSKKQSHNSQDDNQEGVLAKALARIESLENEILMVDLAMAQNSIEYEELNKLFTRKKDLNQELDTALEWWINVSN